MSENRFFEQSDSGNSVYFYLEFRQELIMLLLVTEQ